MQKIIIAAVSENNVIGKDGDIPWHIPEDMEHFKQKTTGHAVIMGRKTFESLPENFRPLPDRKNIVLTRSGLKEKPGEVAEASSLEEGFEIAEGFSDKAFVIGGESVYRESLEEADKLLLTRIHEEYDGDTYFPEIEGDWIEEEREDHGEFSFVTYRRKE